MSFRKLADIPEIDGYEGTKIRQIFHPHNTFNGIRYSIAHFSLEAGKRSHPHKMKTSEVYYILEGEGILHVDEDKYHVSKNSVLYIPPMSRQYIENTGRAKLQFLCIVDPAWKQQDEILLD